MNLIEFTYLDVVFGVQDDVRFVSPKSARASNSNNYRSTAARLSTLRIDK